MSLAGFTKYILIPVCVLLMTVRNFLLIRSDCRERRYCVRQQRKRIKAKRIKPNCCFASLCSWQRSSVPGGSQKDNEELQVTKASDFEATVEAFRKAFLKHNLTDAWKRYSCSCTARSRICNEVIREYNREDAVNCVVGRNILTLFLKAILRIIKPLPV